jgi:hypothetical protein
VVNSGSDAVKSVKSNVGTAINTGVVSVKNVKRNVTTNISTSVENVKSGVSYIAENAIEAAKPLLQEKKSSTYCNYQNFP